MTTQHTPEGSEWKPIADYDTASRRTVEFSAWIVPSEYAQENGSKAYRTYGEGMYLAGTYTGILGGKPDFYKEIENAK